MSLFPGRSCLVFVLAALNSNCYGQQLECLAPLKGLEGIDYFIDYYVDHDSLSGISDAICGRKTYNGHQGTDFLLRSFKTMDSGVLVYSVADGVVTWTKDGVFDRSKHWEGGGSGNYVRILHGGIYSAYYCHLKQSSLLIRIGDTVKAGQPIAQVGSSGYSCYPHLHLEIWDDHDNLVDPFAGLCNPQSAVAWISEPVYDTAVYPIDFGFVPYLPNLDTLLERYLVSDTFFCGRDTVVCLWVQIHGLKAGDNITTEWYTPSGRVWWSCTSKWMANWWYDYFWTWLRMPSRQGRWTARYYVNNRLFVTKDFYVRGAGGTRRSVK